MIHANDAPTLVSTVRVHLPLARALVWWCYHFQVLAPRLLCCQRVDSIRMFQLNGQRQHRVSSIQYPLSIFSIQYPVSSIQCPVSSIQYPSRATLIASDHAGRSKIPRNVSHTAEAVTFDATYVGNALMTWQWGRLRYILHVITRQPVAL